jgi:hypothetical protein
MPPKIPPFQPLAPNDQLYKIACKANELFEKANYTSAVLEYSKGLEVAKPFSEGRRSMDFIALLLSNRSASYFMIKDFENAKKDAEKCCGLRPYWGKVSNVYLPSHINSSLSSLLILYIHSSLFKLTLFSLL